MMWSRRYGPCALACWLGMLTACGGGTGKRGLEEELASTSGGEVIQTGAGRGVTVKAHSNWQDAKRLFAKYEKEGWTAPRCESTIKLFEAANRAQGKRFAESLYMAGLTAERCGESARANNYYESALRADPKLCSARAAVGVDQYNKGLVSQAASTFRQAIKSDPRCAPAYTNLAVIQRQQGGRDSKEALANLRRALAIDASYLAAFNQMALVYLEMAKANAGNEQTLDLAAVVCRQAQLIDAEYAPIYNTWGLISIEKGNVTEALRFFERAAALDPNMFEAHMNFGHVTHSFRGYEDAKAAFSKAVSLRQDSYEAHIGLGAAMRGLNDAAGAKAEYDRAIAIDPRRPEAYFNLGVLYQDYQGGAKSDLETAKQYYGQFLSRAGGQRAHKAKVAEVKRRCARGKRRRRRSSDCRPGRLQNIDTVLSALQ